MKKYKQYLSAFLSFTFLLSFLAVSPQQHVLAASNLAAGKVPASSTSVTDISLVTDGDKDTNTYYDMTTGLQWVQLDLEASYNLNDIKLWHYFDDARKYKDVVVQLSNDSTFKTGVTTVFNNDTNNSAGLGTGTGSEYSETSSGKDIPVASINARYVRFYSNGSNVNAYNHYVEVEIYGSAVAAVIHPTSVNLNKTTDTLTVGGTDNLTATVMPADSSNKNVTWTSSAPGVATVSSTGLVTAVSAGTATITAKTTDGSYTSSCAVTVNNLAVHPTSVSLNKTTDTIVVGATDKLTPTFNPTTTTNKSVTWSSSDAAVASVASDGTVTGLKAGAATITVKTVDGGLTATCNVNVGISVSNLAAGKVATSSASVTDISLLTDGDKDTNTYYDMTTGLQWIQLDLGANYNLSDIKLWHYFADARKYHDIVVQLSTDSTFKTNVTTVFNNDTNNTVGLGAGTGSEYAETSAGKDLPVASVNARYVRFYSNGSNVNAYNHYVEVEIYGSAVAAVHPTSVSLNKTTDTLTVGGTDTLTATVMPANASNKNVTWTSSAPGMATISSTGLVTAVSAGTATITAKTVDGSYTASCAVTVNNSVVHPTSVSLNKTSDTLTVGGTDTLTATVMPANAANKNVTWTSSAPAVVAVSSTGLVTAVSAGTATITAKTVDGNLASTCAVTVKPAAAISNLAAGKLPTAISTAFEDLQLATDGIKSTANYADSGTGSGLQWVQIDLGDSYSISSIKLWHYFGDARKYSDVVVQLSNDSKFTSGVTTVYNNDTDNSAGLGTGTGSEYAETSTGKDIPVSSVNARYARFYSNGSSVNEYNHYAEVEIYGSTGAAAIQTTSVSLNKTADTLGVGGTDALTAAVMPANASNKNVTWTSSAPAVATVSSTGLLTALSVGSTIITVKTADGSYTASCAVTVNNSLVHPTSVSLNKTSDTLIVGGKDTLTATVMPANASNKNVTWTSSAPGVATVSSTGLVTAVSVGTATITAKTVDGNKTSTCSVIVKNGSIKGIDVSKWQGTINWALVKSDGVQFAMIRSSYGDGTSNYTNSGVDPMFETNYAGAKANGIEVGAYHYSYAKTVAQATTEANFFVSRLKGKQLGYPVCVDLEDPSQSAIDKQTLTDIAITYLSIIRQAGYYPMIYCNKSWFTTELDDLRLVSYDHWLAQWAPSITYTGTVGIWQYSSTGVIKGITGNVDLDTSFCDYASKIKSLHLNGF